MIFFPLYFSAAQVGKPCSLNLDLPDLDLPRDLKDLAAKLISPTGKEVPLPTSVNPDNSLGVTFTPDCPGEFKVSLVFSG